MHQQILHNVEMVQDRSSKILQEQEKDLLRAFRARLFDVQVRFTSDVVDAEAFLGGEGCGVNTLFTLCSTYNPI